MYTLVFNAIYLNKRSIYSLLDMLVNKQGYKSQKERLVSYLNSMYKIVYFHFMTSKIFIHCSQ